MPLSTNENCRWRDADRHHGCWRSDNEKPQKGKSGVVIVLAYIPLKFVLDAFTIWVICIMENWRPVWEDDKKAPGKILSLFATLILCLTLLIFLLHHCRTRRWDFSFPKRQTVSPWEGICNHVFESETSGGNRLIQSPPILRMICGEDEYSGGETLPSVWSENLFAFITWWRIALVYCVNCASWQSVKQRAKIHEDVSMTKSRFLSRASVFGKNSWPWYWTESWCQCSKGRIQDIQKRKC